MNEKRREKQKSKNGYAVYPPIEGSQSGCIAVEVDDESSQADKIEMIGARKTVSSD
ncbi:MAG: hypothetical protein P8Z37_18915 [Acidobacteriota bacterium]